MRASLITAVATVIAGAAGFAVASGSGGGTTSHAGLALTRSTAAGPIEISFPAAWKRATGPVPPTAMMLTNPIVIKSGSGRTQGALVVGTAVTQSPTLLPSGLIAALSTVPQPAVVNLAGRSYYRYVDLVPARTGTVENVYALPTTARTVLAACVAPAADAGAFSVACEHALSSLRLTSGQVLPVGPNPAYAARLSVIVSKLNGLRSSAERRLATASTPAGQAKAAQELAQVLATAATQTKKLEPGPIGSSENASIARALQHLGAAYAALANAANHNDRRGYGSARRAEILAATELKSRFEQLSQAGYTIG